MLTGKLGKLVIENKAIFQKAIMAYASIMPEPTKEDCIQPLSHALIDAREQFFLENDVPRKEMVKAAWKIIIDEVEHNDEYRDSWKGLFKIMKHLED